MLLSHFVSKGADNSTFFSGNRQQPWPVVAMAMICAPITGVTFVSVPGMVMTQGYAYLQMAMGFVVGYLIIAWLLIPLFYRLKVVSIYSFLEKRFGRTTYRTGAWFFLVSKILGTAIRFFVVCLALQMMVFDGLGLPFAATVALTMALTWLYTARGGVKSVVWADMFKSFCLIAAILLCIWIVAETLGLHIADIPLAAASHATSRTFFFDNPHESTYFWKEFIAGVFLVVAMTGLDQDMMQHPLSCSDARGARKNMILSSVLQLFVILLFLTLGTLLVMYMERRGLSAPMKSDGLFAMVAFDEGLPFAVAILFVLGLVSASYSSVGSALTSLTTSFTVDILSAHRTSDEKKLRRKRMKIHGAMALTIAVVIILFYYISSESAISAVFTLASFTYGPILGLFVFGLFTKRPVAERWLPAVCIAAPILAWVVQWVADKLYGYQIGYEILLVNASFTIIGLGLLSLSARRLPVATAKRNR